MGCCPATTVLRWVPHDSQAAFFQPTAELTRPGFRFIGYPGLFYAFYENDFRFFTIYRAPCARRSQHRAWSAVLFGTGTRRLRLNPLESRPVCARLCALAGGLRDALVGPPSISILSDGVGWGGFSWVAARQGVGPPFGAGSSFSDYTAAGIFAESALRGSFDLVAVACDGRRVDGVCGSALVDGGVAADKRTFAHPGAITHHYSTAALPG